MFDTPVDNESSEVLIDWITNTLSSNIQVIIPTHFHQDCLGGLEAFHHRGIPSLWNLKTIELAANVQAITPQVGFRSDTTLTIGNTEIQVYQPGPGHTIDNIVGYIGSSKVLFGGCLIKSQGAGKGYLGDAEVSAWPSTVSKLKTDLNM